MAELAAAFPQTRSYRIDSIDFLRGLVMIIMALDHTRDFFHSQAWLQDPLNPSTTTPWLYFTRWITHLCAPIFVFLAGTGGFFQSRRKSKTDLSAFLITRGLWLVIVEVVIINFAFSFDLRYSIIGLQTIWAIGISMIILGLVIWLPFTAILAVGTLIVVGHNMLDFYEATLPGPQTDPGWLYSLLHRPYFYELWDGHRLFILYPFLPWAGLMMLGYCFGKLFLSYEGSRRKKMLLITGGCLILLFVMLRFTTRAGSSFHYGDPLFWSEQKNLLYSIFSFMNVQKYPPSLLFMCATIGIGLIILAFSGRISGAFARFVIVFGRVPFFYYVLHFFLIHLLTAVFFLSRGHSLAEGLNPPDPMFPKFILPGEGYDLWVVYLVWAGIVLLLYPLCRQFSQYKSRNRDKKWLSYL
ncbi:MAG TPA: heparan-alpha-glucosaminide N-acetyltransferase domain-containing protein [Chitinophagaceae bacterium]|nr:heparan-alpha-glucosaminide N-acetyltransferase domain-containing protein [Chitinophagaceae bacterium]